MFDRLDANGGVDLHALAATYMKKMLENKRALPALDAFAQMIRMGLTTEEALNEAIEQDQ